MKTKKQFKVAALMAVFMVVANFAWSTGDAVAKAKHELHEAIARVFNEDISKNGNYLYENHVYKLNDKATVTFRVNDNCEVELLNAKCRNFDAVEYIKFVMAHNEVKADQLLVGNAYTMDIRLKFKAK